MTLSQKTMAVDTEQDPRWGRVVARDRTMDGTFYYSVATTGVYCRPSCPSRRANPKNVRFHKNIADAEAAGFRACKKCKPAQPTRAELRLAHFLNDRILSLGSPRSSPDSAQEIPDLIAISELGLRLTCVERSFKFS